jgi:hypothetical protein
MRKDFRWEREQLVSPTRWHRQSEIAWYGALLVTAAAVIAFVLTK